jgi:thiol-disulfide isomerase/thioredoxin
MTLSRRDWLKRAAALKAGTGLAAAWPLLDAHAQSSSDAAAEARAPGLPPLGRVLKVPDVTLLDGSTVRAGQLDGHVTVIYWWASWCPFCAVQSPSIEKLWRAQQSRGLQMLALSIDRRPADAQAYLKSRGYTFPAAMVTPAVAAVLPKPKGLPVTLVRGRDGKLLQADAGQMFPEDIEEIARFL